MTGTLYRIAFRASRKGVPLYLGVDIIEGEPALILVDDSAPASDEWQLLPIGGTSLYYLCYITSDSRLLYTYFGATGDSITLVESDPWDPNLQVRLDQTDGGWVAINNHDGSRVFDGSGNGPYSNGNSVICYPWNGGGNQQWKFLPVT